MDDRVRSCAAQILDAFVGDFAGVALVLATIGIYGVMAIS
jgi:hypothetical protein